MAIERNYDEPPGSDFCEPLAQLLNHVALGRTPAVIPVADREGTETVYFYSNPTPTSAEITEENRYERIIEQVFRARAYARTQGLIPQEV